MITLITVLSVTLLSAHIVTLQDFNCVSTYSLRVIGLPEINTVLVECIRSLHKIEMPSQNRKGQQQTLNQIWLILVLSQLR